MQHKKLSSKIFYSSIVYLTLFSFLQVTLASDLSIQQDLSFYETKAVALSGGGGGGSGTGSAGGAAPAPAGSGGSSDAGTGTVTVGGF